MSGKTRIPLTDRTKTQAMDIRHCRASWQSLHLDNAQARLTSFSEHGSTPMQNSNQTLTDASGSAQEALVCDTSANEPLAPRSEAQDRTDLANAFRLAEAFGFHEGICNHFSVKLDGDEERYLINPYGTHWSEMQGDSLLLIDGDGKVLAGDGQVEDSAKFIHIGGHRANPRHKALLHTHMPYTTALTMVENGRLEMSHQTAAKFYGRTAYQQTFGGLALSAEEGARLAEGARDQQHVDITFLSSHGVVVGGESVAVAFDDLYYLERASRQQLFAMQTGLPLKKIDDEVIELTAAQIKADARLFANEHFSALSRVITQTPQHRFVL